MERKRDREGEDVDAADGAAKRPRRPTRVWLDGCFDIMHFGHANALRQAKELGDVLVAGLHPSSEIIKHKGLPLMTDAERLEVLQANKWVDEIVADAPYQTQVDFLRKHSIDFCAHGEDISILADGSDSFSEVKRAGMFRLIKRTDGVSTTDLLGRMLSMSKTHHDSSHTVGSSSFLASTRKIVQFSSRRAPQTTDKIVYTAGAFDLMHAGHVSFLKEARKHGDYMIVGCYGDYDVNRRMGGNYPIMNINERVLNLLSLKYVDEVIIGAPVHITEEMLASLRIDIVCRGTSSVTTLPDEPDPYLVVKRKGIYVEIESKYQLSTSIIIERIIQQRLEFEKKKELSERKMEACMRSIKDIPQEIDKHATR
jgi:ethanolamine-phosphate cytidylyltransferase